MQATCEAAASINLAHDKADVFLFYNLNFRVSWNFPGKTSRRPARARILYPAFKMMGRNRCHSDGFFPRDQGTLICFSLFAQRGIKFQQYPAQRHKEKD